MKHRPAESDQQMVVMEGCIPMLSTKLRDMGIINFEELHRFGVQKESDFGSKKSQIWPKIRNTLAGEPQEERG